MINLEATDHGKPNYDGYHVNLVLENEEKKRNQ
jgi:hypothetical protein